MTYIMKHEMTDGIDVGVSNWIEIHTVYGV